MKRTRLVEGDWFAVPLKNGEYGVVVVARCNRSDAILGYFFGPPSRTVPVIDDVAGLEPDGAALIGRSSALGIQTGEWPSIGRLENWNREEWPMPIFAYKDLLRENLYFWRYYDPDDPSKFTGQRMVPSDTTPQGPIDGCYGYVAAQIVLSQRLGVA